MAWLKPCCRKIKDGCMVFAVPFYFFICICNKINEKYGTFNPAK